jgi:hypothetical protein
MGLMDRLLGRTREDRTTLTPAAAPPLPPPPRVGRTAAARTTPQPAAASTFRQPGASVADIDDESNPRWYATPDGNNQRFVAADGRLTVHLIRYGQGQDAVLRFCEDSTGLLVGPTDRRLLPVGLLVSNLRGGSYNEADCRAGDFSPGASVRLVTEPDNPHDSQAVAVFDRTGRYRAGYVNKMKARAYLKRLAAGEQLVAISLRGTRPGGNPGVVSILAAAPAVLAHVRAARPAGSPPPVYRQFTQG